ncbi:MAG: bacteriocin fulvocin C-related protein [Prevotella sp.]|nr:bacteriocin fulvocin C-related protein [Prevotella sp.]
MKKIFFYVAALLLLISCDDEPMYSCNEQTDRWVKENMEVVRNIDRDSFLTYSDSKKRAMYRAFTPEQRISMWKEKLNEVKMLSWNEKELSHITKLEEFIDMHEECFGDVQSGENDDVFDLFFYQWQTYAIDSLGWDRQTGFAIAGTLNRMKGNREIEGGDFNMRKSIQTRSKSEECDCSSDFLNDFCPIVMDCNDKAECEKVPDSCGWLWAKDCNGLCDFR